MLRPLAILLMLAAAALTPAAGAADDALAAVETVDDADAILLVTGPSGLVQCQLTGHATVTRVRDAGGALQDRVVLQLGASRAEARWVGGGDGLAPPVGEVAWAHPCLVAKGLLAHGTLSGFRCDGTTGGATGYVTASRSSPWRLAFAVDGPCERGPAAP